MSGLLTRFGPLLGIYLSEVELSSGDAATAPHRFTLGDCPVSAVHTRSPNLCSRFTEIHSPAPAFTKGCPAHKVADD